MQNFILNIKSNIHFILNKGEDKYMNLSVLQKDMLYRLSQPYKNGKYHPVDAFNQKTTESLVKRNLAEIFSYHMYLHGAVRLTNEGRKVLLESE